MSLKRLLVAWSIAALVLTTAVVTRLTIARSATAGDGSEIVYSIAKRVENGAVIATFFLTCFLIAQVVHVIRARRQRRL